jgi:hypothetical protein
MIVGADTLLRMLDPRWGINIPDMLEELDVLDNRFYVAGRLVDGKFVTRDDIVKSLPHPKYKDNFIALDGRWDVSSTELRNKK